MHPRLLHAIVATFIYLNLPVSTLQAYWREIVGITMAVESQGNRNSGPLAFSCGHEINYRQVPTI